MTLHNRRHNATALVLLLAGALLVADLAQAQGNAASTEPDTGRLPSTKQDDTMTVTFKDKLVFTSADGSTSFRIGGRIQNDWDWMSADNEAEALFGKFEDGNEFRRVRFYISGHIHRWLIFKTQYDFEDGEADFKDVYAGIRGLPYVGTFKAGQFKEPFSLEQLTSSNDITFLERSNADSFSPGRNTGFMLNNCICDERGTWAVGVFRDTDAFGDSTGDGEYNYTGRVTFLPIYQDKGEVLIHTGAAVSFRNPNDSIVMYEDSREVHLAPHTADTGNITDVDSVVLVGLEFAAVCGSVSVQGEYNMSMVDGAAGNNPDFSAWYAQASVLLTGEHRRYDTKNGVFKNPKPKTNFDPEKGTWGAIELVGRYSNLDLTDSPLVVGGDVDSVSGGLNWYLNPNARLMFNVVCADYAEGIGGNSEAFTMRMQFNF